MLSIQKINTNTYFGSNKLYEKSPSSFSSNAEARRAYEAMNDDLYIDYAGGNISLAKYLGKLAKKYWHTLWNEDPTIEIKKQIIEKSLIEGADDEQIKQNLINSHFFDMAA